MRSSLPVLYPTLNLSVLKMRRPVTTFPSFTGVNTRSECNAYIGFMMIKGKVARVSDPLTLYPRIKSPCPSFWILSSNQEKCGRVSCILVDFGGYQWSLRHESARKEHTNIQETGTNSPEHAKRFFFWDALYRIEVEY